MRQVNNLVESWYEATANRPSYSALAGDITADVCVVGGGLAGLTVLRECQARGLSAVMLEASRVAAAASGRNGGFVSSGFALGTEDLAKRVGWDETKALYGLSRMGTDYVRETIARHDPAIKHGDGMRVVLRHPDAKGLQDYADLVRSKLGEEVQVLDVAETRQLLNSERYWQSLYSPQAFHIHTLRYGLLVAELAVKNGARIFEDTSALSAVRDGTEFKVTTPGGTVKARHVVHCVSALGTRLHRPSGRAILPVATYVAVTEPLPQQDAIRTPSAVADTRRAGNYYRLLPDGRILWGGQITTRVSEPARLAEVMRRDMVSVFPQLAKARMQYAWAGLMGYARHMMPLIGQDREGQWFATGFGGHGLNTTAMAGLLVARGLAGEDDAWRRFAAFPAQYGFGQLGRLGVQATYWRMQWQDRLDERRARKASG
ncbi:MAG: FAD-binding oxidoreductase [Hyphomicrobiales bacterium]